MVKPNVVFPTFDDISVKIDYTAPIPSLPDEFITWPGKEHGEPKPPIFWIEYLTF